GEIAPGLTPTRRCRRPGGPPDGRSGMADRWSAADRGMASESAMLIEDRRGQKKRPDPVSQAYGSLRPDGWWRWLDPNRSAPGGLNDDSTAYPPRRSRPRDGRRPTAEADGSERVSRRPSGVGP